MRRTYASSRFLPWFLVALLAPRSAGAHQGSVTLVTLRARDGLLDARIGLASADLADALGMMPGFVLSRDDALAARDEVAAYVRRRLHIANRDGPDCAPTGAARATIVPEGLGWRMDLALRWRCARPPTALRVRYELFFERDPRHRGMLSFEAGDRLDRAVTDLAHREVDLGRAPAHGAVMARFWAMGLEHILTGYDHLALLLALLAAASARPWREAGREVFAWVTAFTAAHSLTLAAATLGWVQPPGRLVEVAIALSILAVCVENLRGRGRTRVALTFAIGLVHGFGFAGSLAAVGLPREAVVTALLAFNLGVEGGQLLALALAWPVLRLLVRGLGPRRTLVVTSAPLALAATWWTFERIVG